MSKEFTPPLDQTVDALVTTRFAYEDDDDEQQIAKTAETQIKEAAKEGTVDYGYEPLRFGNSNGLSMFEKLDDMTRLSMNVLIFHF